MKITCGKVDDISREYKEKQDAFNRAKAQYESETNEYYSALTDVLHRMANKLSAAVCPEGDERLEVKIDPYGAHVRMIKICFEYGQRNIHSDDTALSWDVSVRIDEEGQVQRESGSWSGLKAVTHEQIKNLEQSVAIIKRIDAMDFSDVLKTELPQFKDYVKSPYPQKDYDDQEYKSRIALAELEELVGKPVLVKGVAHESSPWRTGTKVYYLLRAATGAMFTVSSLPCYNVDGVTDKSTIDRWMDTFQFRIRKSTLAANILRDDNGELITREV